MIRKNMTVFTFLLILFLSHTLFSQINIDFESAVINYESEKYEEALLLFEKVISSGNSDYLFEAEFFRGKILSKMGNFEEAEIQFLELIKKNKIDKFTTELKFDLANTELNLGKHKNALISLIEIIQKCDHSSDVQLAKAYSENLVIEHFNNGSFSELIKDYSDDKVLPFLTFVYGKLLLKEGNIIEAKKQFFTIIQNYPESDEYKPSLDYLEQKTTTNVPNGAQSSDLLVAVLLPLNLNQENNSHVSTEILEGIKYAADEFNTISSERIGLVIRDTRGKREEIEKIKKELGNNSAIKAIFGPLYSEETDITCEIFNTSDIPIISPTATDDDLTKKYRNVFQANPSFEMRGKIMAQYIFFVENKKNIAILHSEEGYSNNLARSFQTEFETIGGNIVTVQDYSLHSTNLTEPIREIKKQVSRIEGIYVPISDSKLASLILSNLFLNGIDINLYGNQDWFTATGFESSSSLSNKLTFTSDYFFDYRNTEFLSFSKSYFDKTGTETTRNVFYGYDAAKFFFGILSNSSGEGGLKENLINSNNLLEGYHNNISFGKDRINHWLNIVRFRNGVFELVDKFRYEYQ